MAPGKTLVSQPKTTLFESYSMFTETAVLKDHTFIEFTEDDLSKPIPAFALYPSETMDRLNNWVSLILFDENPSTHLMAINGFTKTGKTTLAQRVLPSLLKMKLNGYKGNLKFSYICFEVTKNKGNAFAIAKSFLETLAGELREIGFEETIRDCRHLGAVVVEIK